ncbi:hypothetical protein EZ313_17860 [Ramlibacter henchirensis]|uniref:Uncharacterized protein n=1 Tax=Ramlibacter henchirensis TaxID=204072 RepID=A0A4Z0BYR2_9BURK|nr:hypothetical protein [Ramlibacter henchirensis]TFZ03079.1 hypothetical protein EZ313_17860 [Ramlibacter henchirensis]
MDHVLEQVLVLKKAIALASAQHSEALREVALLRAEQNRVTLPKALRVVNLIECEISYLQGELRRRLH